jgi:heterotetrameric sarcosine oxidase gamma subunit
VSLEFLSVEAAARSERFAPVAHSPMERQVAAAGGRLEVRDGWSVAVDYGSPEQEAQTLERAAGWADTSHLGKLELQASPAVLQSVVADVTGGAGVALGHARRVEGAWWCPLTATRLLVICEHARLAPVDKALAEAVGAAAEPASLVDVTTAFAALTIAGPLAREVFARFCALDLRPTTAPVGAVRPGSVARQPGIVVREAEARFLMLFGWATAEYMWRQVEEAAKHLGGAPVGVDELAPLERPVAEARS